MLKAADGHVFDAHFAMPKRDPRGGVVVVQEAFGLNAYVRSLCEGFAAEGYAAVAPALVRLFADVAAAERWLSEAD